VVQEGGHCETFVGDAEFDQAGFSSFAPGVKTVNEEVSIIVYDALPVRYRDLGDPIGISAVSAARCERSFAWEES
jgi:hypothetical protein